MKTYGFEDKYLREIRQSLKRADPLLFEGMIKFLLDDPRTFRSGYVKELVWKFIRRYPLTDKDISTLEQAALKYLQRPMCPEFKYMCQTMSHIGTANFWETVKDKLTSANPIEQLNANCLMPYSYSLGAGEKQRQEFDRLKWQYRPRFEYVTHEELLAVLHEGDHWRDGKVRYRELNKNDLTILPAYLWYDKAFNHEIMSLDYRRCKSKILLHKLQRLLNIGYSISHPIYVIYVMQKLDDVAAVEVLIKFLEDRVDHKFDSPTKSYLMDAVSKALNYFSTPEALAAIRARPYEY